MIEQNIKNDFNFISIEHLRNRTWKEGNEFDPLKTDYFRFKLGNAWFQSINRTVHGTVYTVYHIYGISYTVYHIRYIIYGISYIPYMIYQSKPSRIILENIFGYNTVRLEQIRYETKLENTRRNILVLKTWRVHFWMFFPKSVQIPDIRNKLNIDDKIQDT